MVAIYKVILQKSIINKICEHFSIEIPKKEKWMYDKITKRGYAYDFTFNKKIIEFNGDYWHANPKIYKEDFFNKSKNMTAEEIWLYDKQKIKCAKNNEYDILTVWESDYKKDEKAVIEKCIDFLSND